MKTELYQNELNNPLSISKTEISKNKKRLNNFVSKNILKKIDNFENINNELSFDWEELLEKLLNSGTNIDEETIDKIANIIASHKIIEYHLEQIKINTEF